MEADLLFDSTGKIPQIENAEKAVSNGSLAFTLTVPGWSLIASLEKPESIFFRTENKIYSLAKNIFMVSSGVVSDVNFMKEYAFHQMEKYRSIWGEDMPINSFLRELSSLLGNVTAKENTRPFGCSLLFLVLKGKETQTIEISGSGEVIEWKSRALGKRAESVRAVCSKIMESFSGSESEPVDAEKLDSMLQEIVKKSMDKKQTENSTLHIRYFKIEEDRVLKGKMKMDLNLLEY